MATTKPAQPAADENKGLTERVRGLIGMEGDKDMGHKFLIRLTAFATAMALVVLGAGVALAADNVENDQDVVQPGLQQLSVGTKTRGVQFSTSLSLRIVYAGNQAHVAPGSTVVLERDPGSTSGVTVDDISFTIPSTWTTGSSVGSTTTAHYTPGAAETAGPHTVAAAFRCKSGCTDQNTPDVNGNAETLSTSHARVGITYELAAITMGDSVAPADASISIDDGAVWTNSTTGAVAVDISATDAVGINSYRLATSELGLSSATPTSVSPAEPIFSRSDLASTLAGPEGTNSVWLKVCDAANNCSTASDTIGWDKTAPNAPTAAATTTAHYDGGTASDPSDDWWRNSVAVEFTANGDPGGTGASGVKATTLSASETFTTTGTHSTVGGTVDDNAGNRSSRGGLTVKVDASAPTVAFDSGECPTTLVKGSAGSADWTAQDMGSGLSGNATGSLTLDTSAVGSQTVYAPQATDNVGLTSSTTAANSCTFSVVYDWSGFFRPIDNGGVYNKAKAGSAVPVKFSLGGDQGLAIFATGTKTVNGADIEFTYPTSATMPCSNSADIDAIEETVTAGSSSLSYDPITKEYNYVWKTDKGWAGTCRQLVVKLNDGTIHRANFTFTK